MNYREQKVETLMAELRGLIKHEDFVKMYEAEGRREGYSHRWKRPTTINKYDMEQIVGDYAKVSIVMPGFDDLKEEFDVEGVNLFSTRGDTFHFYRKATFLNAVCQTNHEQYDLAICVFLLIAKRRLKQGLHIHTDGNTYDWQKAIDLCARMLGEDFHKFDITTKNKMVRYNYWR